MEFIHTNVLGAENVIEAAIDNGVKTVVALSTDKAAAPVNLYGATKLCSDKLFVAANQYAGTDLRCAVVRYSNVMASRGSVIPLFLDKIRSGGPLPITDSRMTRFNISLDEGVDLVLSAIKNICGGEILVPKIPSFRIIDLAEAVGPICNQEIIGIRPGEKIDEEMITESDGLSTVDLDKYYAILPAADPKARARFIESFSPQQVAPGFSYHSGRNDHFLNVEELRALIRTHVDSQFSPH